jgi:cytoskeletal protein RodZ
MGIGDLLRREREKKGLSQSDVENAIKIRIRYIQAMETEQYQIIPGEVYRLGFLRNYARLLDLDADNIVNLYKTARGVPDRGQSSDQGQTGTLQIVTNKARTVPDRGQAETRQPDAVARRPAIDWTGKISRAGSIFKNRRVLLGVASVIVVLLLALVAFHITAVRHQSVPLPPQKAQQQRIKPAVPPTVETQPPTLEIRLVGKGHCWAEVKVDGQTAYMGTINPGDTQTFTAQSTIWIDLGYPQSVDVYYDGAKLPPLGTTSPVTQTFTKNAGA